MRSFCCCRGEEVLVSIWEMRLHVNAVGKGFAEWSSMLSEGAGQEAQPVNPTVAIQPVVHLAIMLRGSSS